MNVESEPLISVRVKMTPGFWEDISLLMVDRAILKNERSHAVSLLLLLFSYVYSNGKFLSITPKNRPYTRHTHPYYV